MANFLSKICVTLKSKTSVNGKLTQIRQIRHTDPYLHVAANFLLIDVYIEDDDPAVREYAATVPGYWPPKEVKKDGY